MEATEEDAAPLFVSPITAWEMGIFISRGRLMLTTSVEFWFGGLVESGVSLAEMPPKILIASFFLPASPLRDPADRILAATARTYGYRLMTRDAPLLEYAARGHLSAVSC